MISTRLTIEALIFCGIGVAAMHQVPSYYTVRQTFELSGTISSEENLPQDLATAIRSYIPSPLLQRLRCQSAAGAQRLQCTLVAQQKRDAEKTGRLLKDVAPSLVGWMKKEALQSRLDETRTQIEIWSKEFSAMEAELAELEPTVPSVEASLSGAESERATIENDLSMRKRQLEIIEEGLQGKTGKAQEPYVAKKSELTPIVEELQKKLDAVDANILLISKPIERQKTILEALPKLGAQLDLGKAQVASWSSLLKSAGKAPTVADPDRFQLAALPSNKSFTAEHRWDHLPWSLLLGFLFFAFFERKALSGWKDRYFETPDQVIEETGLRFLGTV